MVRINRDVIVAFGLMGTCFRVRKSTNGSDFNKCRRHIVFRLLVS